MKMSISDIISAPLEEVFALVSSPVAMARAFPESVKKMEVLSEQRQGLGSRFRETRILRGKEDVIEIEIIEFVPNESVRSVAETGGSIWYTGFGVAPTNGGTQLTISIEARAQSFLMRIANFCMKPWLLNGGKEEMEGIKVHFAKARAARLNVVPGNN